MDLSLIISLNPALTKRQNSWRPKRSASARCTGIASFHWSIKYISAFYWFTNTGYTSSFYSPMKYIGTFFNLSHALVDSINQ